MFQGFVGSTKFLPQSVVDKMPEEDKERSINTQVGREAKNMFQDFAGSTKFLPQSVVDKMPEEDKERSIMTKAMSEFCCCNT